MKALKIILLIFVLLIGGALIWLSTLDGKFDVKRSVVIDAPPQAVYAQVSDLSTWPVWGVWFDKDSTMTATFNEQTQGQGAWYSWQGESSRGRLDIVEADPGKSMTTKIEFEGMGTSAGNWTFEPEGNATKVTWGMNGELPFMLRFMAAGMDAAVGPDFEAGLANLKDQVEVEANAAASADNAYTFTETMMEAQAIYYQHHDIAMSEMTSALIGTSFGAIATYLGQDAMNMTGQPRAIYHEWDEENQRVVFDLAMPCASEKPGDESVMKGESFAGTVLQATYQGAYEDMMPLYQAADAYINANGYEQNGPVTEVYVTDPMTEADTTKWVTEVYWAVMKK